MLLKDSYIRLRRSLSLKLKAMNLCAEREELTKMMLSEKLKGSKTQVPSKKIDREFHCDTEEHQH